jgi:RNA polymerase sigma factor (TIGR02999 family)
MARTPIDVFEAAWMGSRFLDFAQQTPVKRPEKLGFRVSFHPPVALFVSLSERSLRELAENVLTRVLLFFGGLVMSMMSGDELSDLLRRIQAGDTDAEQQLVALLYQDLRVVAARRMRRERPDHTWQPTVLVNEAFLRLRADGTLARAPDRAFLLKAASKAMRQLLVDHHRRRFSKTRGGRLHRHPLDIALDYLTDADGLPFLELHDELKQLERMDQRAGMVVHFRFFLGMSLAEVAEALNISQKTVERDWSFARAWLRDRLKPTEIP